jgi:hypothetical protein
MTGLNTTVREGLTAWGKSRAWTVKKLTANRVLDYGVQVVALDKSDFAAAYYLRFGILLGQPARPVLEPECHVRMPVEGPWGSQPAFTEDARLAVADVFATLDRYVLPLAEATASLDGLESLYRQSDLHDAFILVTARKQLRWD